MNRSLRDEVEALVVKWRKEVAEYLSMNPRDPASVACTLCADELERVLSRHPPADGVVVPGLMRGLRVTNGDMGVFLHFANPSGTSAGVSMESIASMLDSPAIREWIAGASDVAVCDSVIVPRDLLSDLRDLASDAVIHHHGAMAGYEPEVHADNDRIIAQASAILSQEPKP